MKRRKWTVREIELAVSSYFDYRRNIIIPNVSHGYGLMYEADLLVFTPSRRCYEVEIKVTASDIKADASKRKWSFERPNFIHRLYFAIPHDLRKYCCHIPREAGILSVSDGPFVRVLRAPAINKGPAISDERMMKAMRLGLLRIWTLKRALEDNASWRRRNKANGPT